MKTLSNITIAVTAILALPGCLYTGGDLKRAGEYAYQSGLATGRASQVRQEYHQTWQTGEQTPAPEDKEPALTKKHYYEVPVPAHTASDGVKIEAHTQTIEIVQP